MISNVFLVQCGFLGRTLVVFCAAQITVGPQILLCTGAPAGKTSDMPGECSLDVSSHRVNAGQKGGRSHKLDTSGSELCAASLKQDLICSSTTSRVHVVMSQSKMLEAL